MSEDQANDLAATYEEMSDADGNGLEMIIQSSDWHDLSKSLSAPLETLIGKAGFLALAQSFCSDQNNPTAAQSSPRLAVIVLSDDAAIQELNHTYRSKNTATNVLSFPAPSSDQGQEEVFMAERGGHENKQISDPDHLGDVILAYETIRAEAKRDNKPLEAHISHLVIHGVLHLLGYDHLDTLQAEQMETLETKLLSALNYPNPHSMDEGETS